MVPVRPNPAPITCSAMVILSAAVRTVAPRHDSGMTTVEGLEGLEERAATVLSDAGRRYFERGSGAGLTALDNVAAWDRLVLVPHVLRDVSRTSSATTVLGTDLATPVLVAPTA